MSEAISRLKTAARECDLAWAEDIAEFWEEQLRGTPQTLFCYSKSGYTSAVTHRERETYVAVGGDVNVSAVAVQLVGEAYRRDFWESGEDSLAQESERLDKIHDCLTDTLMQPPDPRYAHPEEDVDR